MKKDIGPYKLALDLGSTSIGWAVLRIKEREEQDKAKMRGNHELLSLEAMGVRIYDDGREDKTKTPTSVARRNARGARRNSDRKKKRVKRLITKLVGAGLFPAQKQEQKELQKLDPYELRKKAIDQKIEAFEIGRILLHIAQRRGFKSNRKSDKNDNEAGAIKKAIAKLEGEIDRTGSRTLGEYLYKLETGVNKRVRIMGGTELKENESGEDGENKKSKSNKNDYTIFPQRKMYEDEFDQIIDKQKLYHGELLSNQVVGEIRDKTIFFQRPLRPTIIGYCSYEYESGEKRAPLALPIVQEFRIYQEIANLDFRRDGLDITAEQRQKVAEMLLKKSNKSNQVTFKAIRKELKVDGDPLFNLESEKRKYLNGHETNVKMSDEKSFGEDWYSLSDQDQGDIVKKLLDEQDENVLKEWLMDKYNVSLERAEYISNISLKDGYGRVSEKAIAKMLPYLKQGYVISKAAELAGYESNRFTGEIIHPLPYYGEALNHRVIGGTGNKNHSVEKCYGKINNPTVHIVLNQLRHLVNACVDEWGHPSAIAIELARDLKESPTEHDKVNAKNKKDNDRIDKELEKLGVAQKRDNRMKYKIWEDLASDPIARCCPFTGKTISASDIFSSEFEVEHLIPYSVSYDNGRGNKVLSYIEANRYKGDRTPYEAFSHSPDGYNWNEILARVEKMRSNFKRSRFSKDARERLAGKDADIIARQLNDTRYLSRVAMEYLQYACDPYKITPIQGALTAMMREKLGLESEEIWENTDGKKNRADHRHHAIDAFVVGCTTRSILQRVSTEAKNQEDKKQQREDRKGLIEKMPDPFEGYFAQVKEHFSKLIISHKPDTGGVRKAVENNQTIGKLHEATAYGLIKSNTSKGKSLYATRKPLSSITTEKDVEEIADESIKDRFLYAVQGLTNNTEFKHALEQEAKRTYQPKKINKKKKGWKNSPENTPIVKKVRIHRSYNIMIPIKKDDEVYKYYQGGGNLYADIFVSEHRDVEDKETGEVKYEKGKWYAEVVSNYNAHKYAMEIKNKIRPPDHDCEWKKHAPMAKRIMRLHKNDMVAYEKDGEREITRVKEIKNKSGKVPERVVLIGHRVASEKAGVKPWAASANQMQKKNARKIRVDILGKVWDPGPYPYRSKNKSE